MTRESLELAVGRLQQSDLPGATTCLASGLADSDLPAPTRSLLLHLLGLLQFARGNVPGSSAAFTEAATVEQDQGWPTGSQHTSHQWALLAPAGSSLSKCKSYYKESLQNLRRGKNHLGAGLCLRSLGELALLAGHVEQALVFWRAGAQSLRRCSAPEFEQLEAWATLLETSVNTPSSSNTRE